MNYLGIDYGEKRIGLAAGDDELRMAMPVPAATAATQQERLKQIAVVIEQRRIQKLVVGYPLNMDGSAGFKAKEVEAFIAELTTRFKLPVAKMDERLTSQQAAAGMAQAQGNKRMSPKQKLKQRRSGELDSRAAAIILQDFFDQQA